MSQATFSVQSFKPSPGSMDFLDLMNTVIAGRANIDFVSTVEIIDPGNQESNDWELGYHQTVISDEQHNYYSDSKGKEIYDHTVNTSLTPANDRIETQMWSWVGWMTTPTKFSSSNKVLTVKSFDRPSCGGKYVTNNKKGNFTRTILLGKFCTWLVARKADPSRTGGEVRWLSWVRWDITLAGRIDPKKFKGTPNSGAGVQIVSQGGQGTPAPVVPALDHIWKDKELWYSIDNATILKDEP